LEWCSRLRWPVVGDRVEPGMGSERLSSVGIPPLPLPGCPSVGHTARHGGTMARGPNFIDDDGRGKSCDAIIARADPSRPSTTARWIGARFEIPRRGYEACLRADGARTSITIDWRRCHSTAWPSQCASESTRVFRRRSRRRSANHKLLSSLHLDGR
jgi:hypothetical protein